MTATKHNEHVWYIIRNPTLLALDIITGGLLIICTYKNHGKKHGDWMIWSSRLVSHCSLVESAQFGSALRIAEARSFN